MGELSNLLMPKLGLTMTEGMLSEWSIAPGDRVTSGDLMFVVETDKVATEITADAEGELREIVVEAGEIVPVGAVVARWTGPGQSAPAPSSAGVADEAAIQAGSSAPAASPEATPPVGNNNDRIIATPLARRLARQHDVDLHQLGGSAPRGRIKAADVRAAIRGVLASDAPMKSNANGLARPVSNLVRTMARRMVEAKQQVPHFYLSAEAEVSGLLALRDQLNVQGDWENLTINHLVLAAVVRALEFSPEQNSIFAEEQIVQFQHIDIGLAISTDRGLVAPVLKGLDGCSLDAIAQRARDLQTRAHDGRLVQDEMNGGAITVSNAGMFNVTYMTPIINSPQSMILGVGSIRELFRPGADATPELRREMGLVLAADHRLHDGASGSRFLNRIIDALQNPTALLRPRVISAKDSK